MARQWPLAGDERLAAAVGPALQWIIAPSSINNTIDKIILFWLKHVLDWLAQRRFLIDCAATIACEINSNSSTRQSPPSETLRASVEFIPARN